jgi:hypothetical protein
MWLYDFKVMLNSKDFPSELFDMRLDVLENNNLLAPFINLTRANYLEPSLPAADRDKLRTMLTFRGTTGSNLNRSDPLLHFWIASQTYPMLEDYAQRGNAAHQMYLANNFGRNYTPTVESDIRWIRNNVYKHVSQAKAAVLKEQLLCSTCITQCDCKVPLVSEVAAFPFDKIDPSLHRLNPGVVANASTILRP